MKVPSVHRRVTVISFWVSVPVLSEQMTVAEPSVSTEARLADQGMVADHLVHAERQADGHHGGQSLGHGRDGQADGDDEDIRDLLDVTGEIGAGGREKRPRYPYC